MDYQSLGRGVSGECQAGVSSALSRDFRCLLRSKRVAIIQLMATWGMLPHGISTLGQQAEFAIDVQTRRRLSIGVIGGLTLSMAGVTPAPRNRKARAMLAYLALESAPLPRERVAAMFWSEAPERHARNSLRQTLFELREALSLHNCNVLGVRRDNMCLIAVRWIRTFRFLDAIAAGRLPETLWRSTQEPTSPCGRPGT